MAHRSLGELDFTRYLDMLHSALPSMTACAVWDASGRLVWHSDQDHAPASMPAPRAVATPREGPEPVWVDGRSALNGHWLASLGEHPAGGPIGTLAVHLADAPRPDATAGRHGAQVVSAVAASIRREYDLLEELNSMAGELASRYDELNLIYHTEDQAADPGQGLKTLRSLVDNCAEMLDVGLAVLLLPDQGISLFAPSSPETEIDTQLILRVARNGLLAWMRENATPLVLNHAADAMHIGDETVIPYKLAACPILDPSGACSGLLAIFNTNLRPDFSNSDRNLLEVMARKAAKILQANYDDLTGLVRRSGFERYLEGALAAAHQFDQHYSLLAIDIDRLQIVNETLGREAGDALLKQVANILKVQVRESDVVSRLGDDEFAVLLSACTPQQGQLVAHKLSRKVVESDFRWQGKTVDISVSIGVTPLDHGTSSAEAALSAAQMACLTAKEIGRNQIQTYQPEDRDLALRKNVIRWVALVQAALREDRFVLFGQPIQPLVPAAGQPHVEVLVRMLDEQGGIVVPGQFIPSAERYFLMPALDRWVVRRTIAMLGEAWRRHDSLAAVYAVNLSGQSLADPEFLEFLSQQIHAAPFPPDRLCFEITETAAIARLDQAQQLIARLKALGCSFALDDFGSGLSSYAYLKDMGVDYVKIDGAFVKDMLTNPVSEAMVQSIRQISRLMGIRSIAEFVETTAIRDRLSEIGVDFAQGYGVGKPVPLGQFLPPPVAATPIAQEAEPVIAKTA